MLKITTVYDNLYRITFDDFEFTNESQSKLGEGGFPLNGKLRVVVYQLRCGVSRMHTPNAIKNATG